jgi:TPR repeat protein
MKDRSPKKLVLGIFSVVAAAGQLHGASWWVVGKHDSAWTNRTLTEITTAAQSSNALAQFYYARACFYGSGRSQDSREALVWLKRAAEQGVADAQYMVARFYLSGTGTAADPRAGVQWAERAATQDHADALAILGDAHGNGIGVDADVVKARQYFERAIDRGSDWALDWFGHFLMNGEGGTVTKTNYATALRCFERAASNGMTHAVAHLVDFYLKGLGAPPNVERAVLWARHAVDRNDIEMMEKLARFYNEGTAEPRDASEATVELFRRAAGGRASSFERFGPQRHTLRDLYALTTDASELCKRYRFGLGTARDYISFAQWLFVLKQAGAWESELKGQRAGIEPAGPHIFDQIVAGKVPATALEEQHIREAVTRVHRALEVADGSACREIGEMYQRGSPLTPESPLLAWLWLNRSAKLRNSDAAAALREVEETLSPEQISKLRNRYLPRASWQP